MKLYLNKLKNVTKTVLWALSLVLFAIANSSAQDIEQMKKLIGENRGSVSNAGRTSQDFFGYAIAVNGNYAVVGAYGEGEGTLYNAGAAFIYKKNGNDWDFFQKIEASVRGKSNQFGSSVAIYGDYIVVGAWAKTQDSNTPGKGSTGAGAAYVFKLQNGVWKEQQEIMASYRAAGNKYIQANFGTSVAINNGYIVVAAPQESIDDQNKGLIQRAGAAYIFKLNTLNETWTEVNRLLSPNPSAYAKFGSSIAIRNNYIFVGEAGLGKVHTYKLVNDEWTASQILTASDQANGDNFGCSTAIGDNYAIVGAIGWKNSSSIKYGAAYILKLNTLNGNWEEYRKISGEIGSAKSNFGTSVAINDNYAMIGNNTEKDGLNLANGVAYVHNISANTTVKINAIDRSDLVATASQFGNSIALNNDQLIIGAWNDGTDENGKNYIDRAGAAYIFKLDNNSWNHQQKIVAIDSLLNNYFGYAVATSGNYAIVGTPQEAGDVNNKNPLSNAGKAYIFKRSSNGDWALQQAIVASDRAEEANFGWSVAIKGDYAIIGAYKANIAYGEDGGTAAGAAYMFKLNGTTWSQQEKLVASDPKAMDYFGSAVSLTENHAVVGAYNKNEDFGGIGAAYVFANNGTNWSIQQKIKSSERGSNFNFGYSIAIDGKNIVVGMPKHRESSNAPIQHGSALVFTFNESNNTWEEAAKLSLTNKVASDWFGWSVAIKGDYIVVGSHQRDPLNLAGTATVSNAGAAYIFKKNGNAWNLLQEIVASDRAASDLFGYAVAINNDYVIVGAYQEDAPNSDLNPTSNNAGAAYIFKKGLNDQNQEVWTETQILTPSLRTAGANFGWTVAIDAYALVGAYLNNTDETGANPVTGAGAAYIFGIPGKTLPVNLMSYTAKAENNYANLQWTTATETDNAKFVIYRSGDNQVFSKIAVLNGNKQSSTAKNYQYLDRKPLNGNNYYKLQQIDLNGTTTDLGIRVVAFNLSANMLSVYPNPVTDKVTISFNQGIYQQLQVIDAQGKTIKQLSISQDVSKIDVNLAENNIGLYLFKLVGPQNTEIKKVIKQ